MTKKEREVMNKCVRDLTPSELRIYQRINKQRLADKLEYIRAIYHSGGDLSGQDSIYVSAALGFIPPDYNIGNYQRRA